MNVRPNDLIQRALRLCGAIGVGRTMTAEEARDGLVVMNGVLDQLAIQRLAIFVENRTLFDLVANQATYTIGPSGDFNVARPVFLPRASVITQVNAPPGQPLELPLQMLTTQDWQQQVPVKSVTAPLPLALYYDSADPLGNIALYPVPSVSDLQVALYLPTAVATFASGTTEVSLAPGYADMLTFQTAVNYASEFGLDIPPVVGARAQEMLANVKRANLQLDVLYCDSAIRVRRGGRYNVFTDTGA